MVENRVRLIKENQMKNYSGRLLKCVTAFVLALLLAVVPIGASAVAAWINSSSAKIYVSKTKSGSVPKGTSVNLVAVSGSWAKITYKGKTGITLLKNVTLKSGLTGYAKYNAPLYKSASTSSAKRGTIPKGTALKVVGITGNFYQVTNTSYTAGGYVPSSYVSKTKPKTSSSNSSSKKNYTKAELVALCAKMQVGKPYAYAEEGSKKFDCSGLTYYVYKTAVGVTLPRSSTQQGMDSRFKTIRTMSQLKAGDLVCFNTGSGTVDHVGVYLGSGKFVHSSYSAGQVITSSFTSYYQDAFLWGKRIV